MGDAPWGPALVWLQVSAQSPNEWSQSHSLEQPHCQLWSCGSGVRPGVNAPYTPTGGWPEPLQHEGLKDRSTAGNSPELTRSFGKEILASATAIRFSKRHQLQLGAGPMERRGHACNPRVVQLELPGPPAISSQVQGGEEEPTRHKDPALQLGS